MYLAASIRSFKVLVPSLFLCACQAPDMSKIKETPAALYGMVKKADVAQKGPNDEPRKDVPKPLEELLEGSLANTNQGSDFLSVLKFAVDTDPVIISKRRNVEAKLAAVENIKAMKQFQVGTTLYGGVEDVTDNTKGLAVALNASRLVYDGGKLDSQIASAFFAAEAAKMDLVAALNERAHKLCLVWLELEKFIVLQRQIDKRLQVLNPLIDQLEQVAKAGIGDVSKVAAAQRTVSAIRVEQTNVSEGLVKARVEFANAFGSLEREISFDYDFLSRVALDEIDEKLVQRSPLLLSQYASYQASIARLNGLRAKEGFDVGFEARALKPFAGSGYDSDESIGLVGRKTLYSGGLLESEIKEAEALIDSGSALMEATYRDGARAVETAAQNIKSMEKAILIARENAELTSDEIVYLKQQLVIGGSTLDNVLSAEARLYEAESKEIFYLTEKHKSQLVIASSLGLLSNSIGF